MSGHIVAEYDDYSLWESPLSEAVPYLIYGEQWFLSTCSTIIVSTYEDALLEPEHEVFI